MVTVSGGRFLGNGCTATPCLGGGLLAGNGLTLTGAKFISNTSTGGGGGIYATFGQISVSGAWFEGNTCSAAGCRGGGLHSGVLLLNSSEFVGNSSTSLGGGLYANSRAIVANSTFSGNQTNLYGGAIGITGTTVLTLTNVTLSGNTATLAGGGLYVDGNGKTNLLNVSVANNAAPSGGGLWAQAGATVGVTNTLFANNGMAGCAGQIDVGSHNLEWPGTPAACALTGPTAGFSTADPLLAALTLNAPGSTRTHALQTGSPARDAGHAATCAGPLVNNFDQRGATRPTDGDEVPGAVCDIGAYEAALLDWRLYLPWVSR
jgi:predicted outer membrane repeat protein